MAGKFFVKLILFVLAFCAADYLMVQIYSGITKSSIVCMNDSKAKADMRGGVDILVLGDSHAQWAIGPRSFKGKLVKWASPAESYVQNYYKLKYFFAGHRADVVILPLDLHSFSFKRVRNMRGDFFWVRYVDYLELARISKEYKHFFLKYLKGSWFPYVGESNTIYEWCAKKMDKDLSAIRGVRSPSRLSSTNSRKASKVKGNTRRASPPKKTAGFSAISPGERRKLAEIRASNQLKDSPFSDVLFHYLKRIVRLCEKEQTNLILVKFPVALEYYQQASKLISVGKLYKRIDDFVKRYKHVTVLDYQGIFFHEPQSMADVDHVNAVGAKMISTKINRSILKKKLLGKQPEHISPKSH